MSEDDFLKDIVGKPMQTDKKTEDRQQEVIKKIRRSENQGDFLDFGLVKIWTILLEFFAQLQVSTQNRKDFKDKNTNTNDGD